MTIEIEERTPNRRRDGEDDIICRIKIDPSIFNGILNIKIFSN